MVVTLHGKVLLFFCNEREEEREMKKLSKKLLKRKYLLNKDFVNSIMNTAMNSCNETSSKKLKVLSHTT